MRSEEYWRRCFRVRSEMDGIEEGSIEEEERRRISEEIEWRGSGKRTVETEISRMNDCDCIVFGC